MTIRIYNSLTRRKEDFQPWNPPDVGMYVCGPTVYMNSHIGHGVGPVTFDVIKRWLTLRGYRVTMVINITDVEDKLIDRAAAEHTTVERLARGVEADYMTNIRRLGVANVDHFPRATEFIPQIIRLIERLLSRGHAYAADGDVYFSVATFSGYGKLSGRKVEELIAGARVAPDELKREPADFALWKASKPGEPAWDSPWGKGRPGWHIECSAMSMHYLGESVDIHGGGLDLIFPHHENEIAQSEAATGRPFAKYWMHNGLMQLEGEKMSKSKGNLVTMTELLARHSPELIRFFPLSTHYRRPIDFGESRIAEVSRGLAAFYRLFDRVKRATGKPVYDAPAKLADESAAGGPLGADVLRMQSGFFEAMDDDFNTAGAIGVLFDSLASINRFMDERGFDEGKKPSAEDQEIIERFIASLRALGALLGVFEKAPEQPEALDDATVAKVRGVLEALAGKADVPARPPATAEEMIELLITVRANARKAKNFALGDEVRSKLKEAGIVLEDRPTVTTWSKAT